MMKLRRGGGGILGSDQGPLVVGVSKRRLSCDIHFSAGFLQTGSDMRGRPHAPVGSLPPLKRPTGRTVEGQVPAGRTLPARLPSLPRHLRKGNCRNRPRCRAGEPLEPFTAAFPAAPARAPLSFRSEGGIRGL